MATTSRYGYIDTLRGLSALGVIVAHMSQVLRGVRVQEFNTVEAAIFNFIGGTFDTGKIGVLIFFCISGFLIPNSLSETNPHPLKRFVTTRFFRLYPAYWLSIIVSSIAFIHLNSREFTLSTIAINFSMLQQFFGVENIQGLYWTLQIELIFYAACVALFVFGKIRNLKFLLLMVFAMMAIAVAMSVTRYFTDSKLPVAVPLSLMLMFWAYIWRLHLIEAREGALRAALIVLAAFTIALPIICFTAYNKNFGYNETWDRYYISYMFSILAFGIYTKYFRTTSRLTEFLGKISYSLYLFGSVGIAIEFYYLGGSSRLPPVVDMCAAILISIAIASAAYYALEEPSIAAGKKVIEKIRSRSPSVHVSMIGAVPDIEK